MRQHTDLMAAVYNALGTGHKNARTRAELCAALGCNDRELREAIEALRWERPIITNDDGTGYYIPTQDSRGWAEASMWLSRQNKRHKTGHQGRKALYGTDTGGENTWIKA